MLLNRSSQAPYYCILHTWPHTDTHTTHRTQTQHATLKFHFHRFGFGIPDSISISRPGLHSKLGSWSTTIASPDASHNLLGIMFISSAIIKAASRKSFATSRNVVTVTSVMGREIIDSRGNPTVEVDVHTTAGRFRGDHFFL